jgi:aminoglycoside 3-N-acetyltransferase I
MYQISTMDLGGDDFQVTRLGKDDLFIAGQLFVLLQKVFEVENIISVSDAYVKKLLENPAFIVFAALYKNEIVGGLTAYELPMYNTERSEIYIYDIAVKSEYQRIGIGIRLISAVKEYGAQNGITEIFVQASEEDKYAIDFYRSTEAFEEKVIHFTYPESSIKTQ